MDLSKILDENKKFNEWDKKIKAEIKEKQKAISELNEAINFEDVKALGYDKAREIFKEIQYNLDYKELRPKFSEVLEELKKVAYPEILKAHYYPVLNEIDFLTEKQINILDSKLYEHRRYHTIKKDNFRIFGDLFENYRYDDDLVSKIIEFMISKDMLKKRYVVTCPCGEESETIEERRYENMKKYFDIESRFKTDNVTEEEEAWYEEFDTYRDGFVEIGCECEGLEICSISDIEDNLSIEYKLGVEADTTLALK